MPLMLDEVFLVNELAESKKNIKKIQTCVLQQKRGGGLICKDDILKVENKITRVLSNRVVNKDNECNIEKKKNSVNKNIPTWEHRNCNDKPKKESTFVFNKEINECIFFPYYSKLDIHNIKDNVLFQRILKNVKEENFKMKYNKIKNKKEKLKRIYVKLDIKNEDKKSDNCNDDNNDQFKKSVIQLKNVINNKKDIYTNVKSKNKNTLSQCFQFSPCSKNSKNLNCTHNNRKEKNFKNTVQYNINRNNEETKKRGTHLNNKTKENLSNKYYEDPSMNNDKLCSHNSYATKGYSHSHNVYKAEGTYKRCSNETLEENKISDKRGKGLTKHEINDIKRRGNRDIGSDIGSDFGCYISSVDSINRSNSSNRVNRVSRVSRIDSHQPSDEHYSNLGHVNFSVESHNIHNKQGCAFKGITKYDKNCKRKTGRHVETRNAENKLIVREKSLKENTSSKVCGKGRSEHRKKKCCILKNNGENASVYNLSSIASSDEDVKTKCYSEKTRTINSHIGGIALHKSGNTYYTKFQCLVLKKKRKNNKLHYLAKTICRGEKYISSSKIKLKSSDEMRTNCTYGEHVHKIKGEFYNQLSTVSTKYNKDDSKKCAGEELGGGESNSRDPTLSPYDSSHSANHNTDGNATKKWTTSCNENGDRDNYEISHSSNSDNIFSGEAIGLTSKCNPCSLISSGKESTNRLIRKDASAERVCEMARERTFDEEDRINEKDKVGPFVQSIKMTPRWWPTKWNDKEMSPHFSNGKVFRMSTSNGTSSKISNDLNRSDIERYKMDIHIFDNLKKSKSECSSNNICEKKNKKNEEMDVGDMPHFCNSFNLDGKRSKRIKYKKEENCIAGTLYAKDDMHTHGREDIECAGSVSCWKGYKQEGKILEEMLSFYNGHRHKLKLLLLEEYNYLKSLREHMNTDMLLLKKHQSRFLTEGNQHWDIFEKEKMVVDEILFQFNNRGSEKNKLYKLHDKGTTLLAHDEECNSKIDSEKLINELYNDRMDSLDVCVQTECIIEKIEKYLKEDAKKHIEEKNGTSKRIELFSVRNTPINFSTKNDQLLYEEKDSNGRICPTYCVDKKNAQARGENDKIEDKVKLNYMNKKKKELQWGNSYCFRHIARSGKNKTLSPLKGNYVKIKRSYNFKNNHLNEKPFRDKYKHVWRIKLSNDFLLSKRKLNVKYYTRLKILLSELRENTAFTLHSFHYGCRRVFTKKCSHNFWIKKGLPSKKKKKFYYILFDNENGATCTKCRSISPICNKRNDEYGYKPDRIINGNYFTLRECDVVVKKKDFLHDTDRNTDDTNRKRFDCNRTHHVNQLFTKKNGNNSNCPYDKLVWKRESVIDVFRSDNIAEPFINQDSSSKENHLIRKENFNRGKSITTKERENYLLKSISKNGENKTNLHNLLGKHSCARKEGAKRQIVKYEETNSIVSNYHLDSVTNTEDKKKEHFVYNIYTNNYDTIMEKSLSKIKPYSNSSKLLRGSCNHNNVCDSNNGKKNIIQTSISNKLLNIKHNSSLEDKNNFEKNCPLVEQDLKVNSNLGISEKRENFLLSNNNEYIISSINFEQSNNFLESSSPYIKRNREEDNLKPLDLLGHHSRDTKKEPKKVNKPQKLLYMNVYEYAYDTSNGVDREKPVHELNSSYNKMINALCNSRGWLLQGVTGEGKCGKNSEAEFSVMNSTRCNQRVVGSNSPHGVETEKNIVQGVAQLWMDNMNEESERKEYVSAQNPTGEDEIRSTSAARVYLENQNLVKNEDAITPNLSCGKTKDNHADNISWGKLDVDKASTSEEENAEKKRNGAAHLFDNKSSSTQVRKKSKLRKERKERKKNTLPFNSHGSVKGWLENATLFEEDRKVSYSGKMDISDLNAAKIRHIVGSKKAICNMKCSSFNMESHEQPPNGALNGYYNSEVPNGHKSFNLKPRHSSGNMLDNITKGWNYNMDNLLRSRRENDLFTNGKDKLSVYKNESNRHIISCNPSLTNESNPNGQISSHNPSLTNESNPNGQISSHNPSLTNESNPNGHISYHSPPHTNESNIYPTSLYNKEHSCKKLKYDISEYVNMNEYTFCNMHNGHDDENNIFYEDRYIKIKKDVNYLGKHMESNQPIEENKTKFQTKEKEKINNLLNQSMFYNFSISPNFSYSFNFTNDKCTIDQKDNIICLDNKMVNTQKLDQIIEKIRKWNKNIENDNNYIQCVICDKYLFKLEYFNEIDTFNFSKNDHMRKDKYTCNICKHKMKMLNKYNSMLLSTNSANIKREDNEYEKEERKKKPSNTLNEKINYLTIDKFHNFYQPMEYNNRSDEHGCTINGLNGGKCFLLNGVLFEHEKLRGSDRNIISENFATSSDCDSYTGYGNYGHGESCGIYKSSSTPNDGNHCGKSFGNSNGNSSGVILTPRVRIANNVVRKWSSNHPSNNESTGKLEKEEECDFMRYHSSEMGNVEIKHTHGEETTDNPSSITELKSIHYRGDCNERNMNGKTNYSLRRMSNNFSLGTNHLKSINTNSPQGISNNYTDHAHCNGNTLGDTINMQEENTVYNNTNTYERGKFTDDNVVESLFNNQRVQSEMEKICQRSEYHRSNTISDGNYKHSVETHSHIKGKTGKIETQDYTEKKNSIKIEEETCESEEQIEKKHNYTSNDNFGYLSDELYGAQCYQWDNLCTPSKNNYVHYKNDKMHNFNVKNDFLKELLSNRNDLDQEKNNNFLQKEDLFLHSLLDNESVNMSQCSSDVDMYQNKYYPNSSCLFTSYSEKNYASYADRTDSSVRNKFISNFI
ncbi:hypothetical protein POVCU2_0039350 [Plasmodium ovale curtisi]|uniref:Uncharacterized protein n=1 Tax=Plasmodium ovale curtisi TaxID=864141 RepID=A0A1A8W227_PLAOA|nr:hypothetical protein POVCU2_0039350 [Plasmodium ovale curtisi]SBS97189.1 hypothetical protein POVCU1_036220 [Plasmodium ovale curtisi]